MYRYALLLLVALVGAVAFAQDAGALHGRVADATSAPIEGATVVVRNAETGASRTLVTGGDGLYDAPTLAVGRYEVTANKAGFEPVSRQGITLVVGQRAEVDLQLSVGELKQMVTVDEQAPVVTLSTEQTSGLVGERQVKDLPLNGRSYDGLMTLNPGVVNYTSQRSGGVGTSNSAVGNMFSASGRRPQESIFLLNGIEYTSASVINLSPGGASG